MSLPYLLPKCRSTVHSNEDSYFLSIDSERIIEEREVELMQLQKRKGNKISGCLAHNSTKEVLDLSIRLTVKEDFTVLI